MGQALSNFAASLCGDTGLDEFQSSTRTSHTHIFPQRSGPQIIQTPLSWSRGSDSFTNSVTNRIVRHPPPGSDPDRDSSYRTREMSQLGLGHLVTRDGSDSVRQLGRDPALSWSHGSDSFTHSGTNSVLNRIVRNPPPRSDPYGDSSPQTRKVSQLGHGHLITRDESNSASQLRRDPVITLPKWLDVSLKDSSITVLEEKKEVVREVLRKERARDEERGGGAKVGREERWMKHYSSFQKILLVGEGDFSFSACLAVAFGCAHNIIATSLDSREFLVSNYMNAMSNIESLTSRGAKVMHGVDATQMANHFVFLGMTFDRIVFNFPHGGFFRNESRETQLRRQQKLVRLFIKNAKKMIDKMGEIHISHKSNYFFREWNLEGLATNEGLRLIESLHFRFTDYPGYHTKYGFGGDKNFNCNPSKTYKFGLKN
ncbi:methyltransferase small domain protein, putative [Actinidia rufa]|uniref:Methyltransferase small domain protein, putative n=1 Tax=Actinidia rufa TaxID=165716 RepID=A0A7J0F4N1_9ERIC|nr:methyltransferase small domain protein, putative [Actinidia rufa]